MPMSALFEAILNFRPTPLLKKELDSLKKLIADLVP